MDFTQEFSRAWLSAFPDHPQPCHEKLCACLNPNSPSLPSASTGIASLSSASSTSTSDSVSSAPGAGNSRLAQIEVLIQELNSEAERLDLEARQKRFVADFLDRLLLKLTRNYPELRRRKPEVPINTSGVPRGTRYSVLSPVVPRGTLTKVKDALRQSGMLLDSSDEEGEGGEEREREEERVDEGDVNRRSTSHYAKAMGGCIRLDSAGNVRVRKKVPAHSSGSEAGEGRGRETLPLPVPNEGHETDDSDSIDDYLYDTLSDSEDPHLPGRELAPRRVTSKPFEPPKLSLGSESDDPLQRSKSDSNTAKEAVYVSVDDIKRKKQDRASIGAPKTIHDRLSYAEGWKGRDDHAFAEEYEQLGNTCSSSAPSLATVPDSPSEMAIGHRRPRDRGGGSPADGDLSHRQGMACVSQAITGTSRMGRAATADDDEDPYDLAMSEEELACVKDEEEIDDVGRNRSAEAVARRLARANQRALKTARQTLTQKEDNYQQQRLAGMPWQFDHDKMLREAQGDTRRMELVHILKNEEMHLQVLEIMNGCQRLFVAHNFPEQKTKVIFSRVSELRESQEKFVMAMVERLNKWEDNSTIADVFALLNDYQPLKDYISNLPTAIKCFEEVITERRDFAERIEMIKVQGKQIMFRDLLHQPVVWLTKSSENMKRIIEHTPLDHNDREPLEKLLRQLLDLVKSGTFGGQKERAISVFGSSMAENGGRSLIRHSLLVEMSSNGHRKLRHVFLFTDILVCAKPRSPAAVGSSFEVRWFIPVHQAVIYKVTDTQSEEMKSKRKAEIETQKQRIKQLRKEIKKELDKEGLANHSSERRSSFRRWNWAPGRRGVDKLKEQLHKTQAQLVLASPNLEFKVSSSNEKKHTLLMSSEFERRAWSDAINGLRSDADKWQTSNTIMPNTSDVQILLEDFKDMVSVNKLGSCLLHDGQEGVISGVLKVKIHRVEGLKEPMDCIVCVEVDSFEHFDLCAKTSLVGSSCDPEINQEFDIELDFSTTVRFIVCREALDVEGRTTYQNIAKLELRLDIDSLNNYVETPHGLATFSDPSHSILLTLSLSYQAAFQTLARQPSERRGGLFGVPLEKVVHREQVRFRPAPGTPQVPLLVRACTDELDRRALEEPGIYRISGMSADVAKLRDNFDRNVSATSRLLADYDVHVISGVLKAYLRELPEPLFTVERYQEFMNAYDLSPIEVKRVELVRLLHTLPEPNLSTAKQLLRHFARVNRKGDINKMVAGNLGLVFGPTLLSPASAILPQDILSVTMESFRQSGILTLMITLTTDGSVFADEPI